MWKSSIFKNLERRYIMPSFSIFKVKKIKSRLNGTHFIFPRSYCSSMDQLIFQQKIDYRKGFEIFFKNSYSHQQLCLLFWKIWIPMGSYFKSHTSCVKAEIVFLCSQKIHNFVKQIIFSFFIVTNKGNQIFRSDPYICN